MRGWSNRAGSFAGGSCRRGRSAEEAHVTGSRQRRGIPFTAEAEAPRRYFFAELETGATLAALNEALEWRGIAAADVVAVRCRPPPAARRHRPAHYRVVYAR
jgi:hypothetical protein